MPQVGTDIDLQLLEAAKAGDMEVVKVSCFLMTYLHKTTKYKILTSYKSKNFVDANIWEKKTMLITRSSVLFYPYIDFKICSPQHH